MSTSNQQTLADSRANERPPMLEKGNYIPGESRFRRFLDNKLEDGERMWNLVQNRPYKRPMIPNPNNDQEEILEPLSKMTARNKSQYIAEPGASIRRDTGSYYPKRYWELLPKEILVAITQRDIGSYYPKRYWDVLWENRARSVDLQGGRCMRVFCYKEVTRRCLEDLELKGGDGGACNVLGWLLGDVMMMQGSIPFVLSWGGSISSDSFLPSILLLVVIIITVVIVVVILIVVVVVIIGVVIVVAIIGVVVVVGGVSYILKLSFVIIGFLRKIVFYYLLHQPMGYGNGFLQSLRL
ncbi:retrovirus-related pol polyprotein from transposon TNT 1-94 [Tanacetum coccineum]|uniref:Retrovirus-related pol polyprotein from transposon TNT 1-94 n=1 Tax=Tanacetum coccineum TaxID=301880 RepID=A0ABQ5DR18_9ASTR